MIVHPSLAVNILIVIGEGFWVLSAATQLHRLVKTRITRGLSAASTTLNTAGTFGWMTYFAIHHLWFPFATNIVMFILGLLILGYILSNKEHFGEGLLAILIIAPITSYLLLHFPDQSGWLGMLYNWIATTPWLLKVVLKKKVGGISERSLWCDIGALSFTLSYALIIHSTPLIAGCLQGFVYASIILTYYYRDRSYG